jgi:hypothetical protein
MFLKILVERVEYFLKISIKLKIILCQSDPSTMVVTQITTRTPLLPTTSNLVATRLVILAKNMFISYPLSYLPIL